MALPLALVELEHDGGFQPSPVDPMTPMITLRDAHRALTGENDT